MKLYRVKVIPGGRPLKFREAGGKVYTNLKYAQSQLNYLRKSGVNAVLLETPDFEWIESNESV